MRHRRGEQSKAAPFPEGRTRPGFMRAAIRSLTAIVMIGICGASVVRGWRIVDFSLLMMNHSQKEPAEIINKWIAVPGLASTALRAELTDETNPSAPKGANRRRKALSKILSIQPLSSMDWLSLSRMQLVTDQPMKQVLGSFKLSVLTGPNEESVMPERGIFGISIWDSLPHDIKSHVAVDLLPIIFPRTPAEGEIAQLARTAISAETDRVRNELREALLATGLSRQEIERRLGF